MHPSAMYSRRRSPEPRISRQSGVIVIPFLIGAVTIVTLLGALTEATLVLHARHKLSNGAESALLAACNLYGTGNYTQTQLNDLLVSTYAANNFMEADPAKTQLVFNDIGGGVLAIDATRDVNTFFLKNISVKANVAATIPMPVIATGGSVPLAVEVFPYVIGTTYVIKEGGGAGSNGNYGPLALSGSGASDYEYDLTNGYSGTLSVGQSVSTKPGNVNGPTERAVLARLAANKSIVIVVLTNDVPQGRDAITIVGFAAFQIISADDKGAITGKFINYKITATPSSTPGSCNLCTKPKLIYY